VLPAQQRARFLAPGDKLGKYSLVRQIAVGGMAELYLARTMGIEGFEKLCVVKRILPQYADNPNFVTMFLNEARLAATLQHPNITQVYDIGVEDGEYFFSMEYVHGQDLGRITTTAHEHGVPVSLDAALTLVTGLCAGLHYAHDKASAEGKPLEVVHRDVSPSNVLVSYDGCVKLVDFGIARAAGATTTSGGLKGKIAYMSPEQCRGKGTLDRRSDLFSVGTLLYELTTGTLPFTDETEYGLLNQIVNQDVPPPTRVVPTYPLALERIVMRALARDPAQRFSTALEMQTAIEDFAHENRLRVSPLVLARLMGTLFPARLEEWDHARAQGAFFVEQHVVRTLIESGTKSGVLPIVEDENTTLDAPPEDLTRPRLPTPSPTRMPTPVPEPAVPRTITPVGGIPGAVPIVAMPVTPPPAVAPGVLVTSSSVPHNAFPTPAHDVTQQVRVPVRRSGTVQVSRRGRRAPVVIIAASCVLAAALAGYVVFRGDDAPAKTAPQPAIATPTPPAADVTPADPPKPAEAPVPPAPEPAVEPAKPDPPVDKKHKVTVPPHIAKRPPARPKPKAASRKPDESDKEPEPEVKPDPKDGKWNNDSVFMPVRTDKK
jgi:serine/threonine protein kinase